MDILERYKKFISMETWNQWSEDQKKFVLDLEGKKVSEQTRRNYQDKKWELGKARPEFGEACKDCSFPFCFYAEPRNWSMSSSADVWNLMKCANVNCGKLFESCL
jgi:hypothetical protein